MLKQGVRYIAIASGPIGRRNHDALLVGVIFRSNYMEGILSGTVKRDGADSTANISRMIMRSRFREQIRILLFNGIALAGLNVIDIDALREKLNSEIVLLNRKRQNAARLVNALRKFSRADGSDVSDRIRIIKVSASMRPLKVDNVYMQSTLEDSYAKRFAGNAFEALRIAHMIARGLSTGESRGRL